MNKSEDKISFSQEMQLNVRRKRTAFPVDMIDWERLRRMITNSSPSFVIWANVSSAGFSASLAIFLTWLTVIGEETYPYKSHLLAAVFVTGTIGIMAAIFARDKKKDEAFSQNQILQEMDTMQVATEDIDELQISNKFKILKAVYGVPKKNTDVTERLNELVVDESLNTRATNALVPIDPAPGVPKLLEVEYENEGEKSSKQFAENDLVILP